MRRPPGVGSPGMQTSPQLSADTPKVQSTKEDPGIKNQQHFRTSGLGVKSETDQSNIPTISLSFDWR